MASKRKEKLQVKKEEMDPSDEDSDGSDGFDPDEVEVPGGGKNIDQIIELRKGEPSSSAVSGVKVESNDGMDLDQQIFPANNLRNEILNPGMAEILNQSLKDRYDAYVKNRRSNTEVASQGVANTMPRSTAIPQTLNPFQTATSNFLSGNPFGGGSPFASLFSGLGNTSQPGPPPPPSNNNMNPNLGQYNNSHMFSNSTLLNKSLLNFNRFLGNPAIENLYRSILSDISAPYQSPEDMQNQLNQAYPPGGPGRGPRLPSTSRRPNLTVTQLWQNANVKMNQFVTPGVDPAEEQDDDQEDEDMAVAETYADYKPAKLHIGKRHPDPVIETASMASVLAPDITLDLNLPDKVINSGSLSALQLEAVTYACQQHEFDLRSGVRSGYLIGDGAGVGKGRTIAGIIYENWLHDRRKSLWISVSADLKYDSERDLKDIGATMIKVYPLNKLKYGKIQTFENGVIFATYSALIGESAQGGKFNTRLKQIVDWCGKNFNGVIVFDECHRAKNLCPTGSSKPTKTGKTVHELQELLPRARVVYASATGASEPRNMAYMTRLGIWGEGTPFPDFQAFISSVEKRGVGAMEIVAMDMKLRGAYIARQLSFQGVTFTIEEVPLSKESIEVYDEAVELWVEAMQKFIEGIELMMLDNRKRKAIWAQFWASHQRFFKYLCIAAKVKKAVQIARDAVKDGKCVVIGLQSTGEARTLDQLERDEGELTDFVSTAKGVLQTLIEKHFPGPVPSNGRKVVDSLGNGRGTSSIFEAFCKEMEAENGGASSSSGKKRKPVRQAARKAVKRVKMTESDDSEAQSDKDSDFDAATESSRGSASNYESEESIISSSESEAEEDLEADLINKRGSKSKKGFAGRSTKPGDGNVPKPSKEAKEIVYSMKAKLLERVEKLGERLPPNTLDQLIDELGGPMEVAEMTGRKGRVIQDDQGNVSYEARSEAEVNLECINLAEKERFMSGEKYIAIISEAASSGISLQSDKRVSNQRRRVHITLELPWSADRAIQQFGRTHRSNQVNAPEYVFLISDLAGEHRFASIVAKRLESLGALTHGDRRATESRDLSRFHIDNKYGRMALESVMRGTLKLIPPLIPPPADYEGDFFADMAGALVGVGLIVNSEDARGVPDLEKDYNNMSKFLNRILGMPVKLQNYLFKYFTDTLNFIIKQAKRTGRFDVGIVDLSDNGSNEILRTKKSTYQRQHATGIGTIELHELQVERGMSWEKAMEKHEQLFDDSSEGFYLAKQVRNGKRTAILTVSETSSVEASKNKGATYTVYRPNTGIQAKREVLRELKEKFEKVTPDKAKPYWEDQFKASKTTCTHAYWSGNCKNYAATKHCDIGLRLRKYHVLSGSVLLVWGIIEGVFQMYSHGHNTPKMQVVRVRFSVDDRIVGVLIPNYCANELGRRLAEGAVSSSISRPELEPDLLADDNSDFEEV